MFCNTRTSLFEITRLPLRRPFVQQEIGWAIQYGKKIIVVYEADGRRAGYFDHEAARAKYRGTELEFVLDIDAISYQRDDDYAEAMLRKIIAKATSPPLRSAGSPLNVPGSWDFFLSHAQATGGDQIQTISLRLKTAGKTCW